MSCRSCSALTFAIKTWVWSLEPAFLRKQSALPYTLSLCGATARALGEGARGRGKAALFTSPGTHTGREQVRRL